MKKFAIKKPSSSNPSIWEWKTHIPVGTVTKLVYFDTIETANLAGQEWGDGFQIVELNLPDDFAS
jgi:hypothetical protein